MTVGSNRKDAPKIVVRAFERSVVLDVSLEQKMIQHKSTIPKVEPVYCPHCGSRISSFTDFTYGNIELKNNDEVLFEGRSIHLTPNQHMIVDALVRAQGRLITRSTLAMAIGADVFDDAITAHIKRTRESFRIAFPDFDQIQVARGFGAYRWIYRMSSTGAKLRNAGDLAEPCRSKEPT